MNTESGVISHLGLYVSPFLKLVVQQANIQGTQPVYHGEEK
jgi:hypothetical protein